jgi:hypothetical protein
VDRLKVGAERRSIVTSVTHLLLNDATQAPWKEHTFRRVFADVRDKAVATIPACCSWSYGTLP